MSQTAIDIHRPGELDAPSLASAMTPMEMLSRAVERGASLEVMERLSALAERWDANQARKAFDAAMSAAKADIQPVVKNRVVDFTSQKGRTNYRHEDLGEIARTVDPILARHGLSYRFRTEQQEGGAIRVVCIVAHRDGHAEENALMAGRDESGNKNNIQAIGSTITYLQRYTLKAALGLAASNDDDGRSAGASTDTITDDQAAKIMALLTETKSDINKFLDFAGAESVSDIPARKYQELVRVLAVKKGKQQ